MKIAFERLKAKKLCNCDFNDFFHLPFFLFQLLIFQRYLTQIVLM